MLFPLPTLKVSGHRENLFKSTLYHRIGLIFIALSTVLSAAESGSIAVRNPETFYKQTLEEIRRMPDGELNAERKALIQSANESQGQMLAQSELHQPRRVQSRESLQFYPHNLRLRAVMQETQRRERLKPRRVQLLPERKFPESMPEKRRKLLQAQYALARQEAAHLHRLGPLTQDQREAAQRQWRVENRQKIARLENLHARLRNSPEMQTRSVPLIMTAEQFEFKDRLEMASPKERQALIKTYQWKQLEVDRQAERK